MAIQNHELARWLALVEESYFEYSLGNRESAKKRAISAVKLLNGLANQSSHPRILKSLSTFSLKHYDELSNSRVSVSDQLLWLSSKLTSSFPPVIHFDDINSMDRTFLENEFVETNTAMKMTPPSVNVEFRPFTVEAWVKSPVDFANLYQDLLPNCSFVSSLLSISSSNIDLITNCIVSNDSSTVFKVKFFFNGSWRLVLINNELPFLPDDPNRNIMVRSSSNANLVWPALIEKAYLKVMGQGYCFNGSNMATDTYILCGWLPEIVTLKNFALPQNFKELWALKKRNRLMLGIGTGTISKELSNQLQLISNHDYVIEDYDEYSRELVIKNPWVEKDDSKGRLLKLSTNLYFKYLYINWNPETYRHKASVNFIVKGASELHKTSQFSLTNPTDQEIDIGLLLERHLSSDSNDIVIDFQVYQTNRGERVLSSDQYPCKDFGSATNNRLRYGKLKMEPHEACTVVVTSSQKSIFTLSVFNNVSDGLVFEKSKNRYSNWVSMEGEWNITNNGGNWANSSYIMNPQYDIELTEKTDVLVALFAEQPDTIVGFHLLNSDKAHKAFPIRNFDNSKLIVNSNYNQGSQIHYFQQLGMGSYKLVLSTYDRSMLSKYTLAVNSSHPIEMSKTSTSIGLYTKTKTFDWNNNNRYKLYFDVVNFNCRLTFHVHRPYETQHQTEPSQYVPAIRGSVFRQADSQPVIINEGWNNSIYGIFVDCTIEQPGTYILLVERFEMGRGNCVVDIGSDKKVEISRELSR